MSKILVGVVIPAGAESLADSTAVLVRSLVEGGLVALPAAESPLTRPSPSGCGRSGRRGRSRAGPPDRPGPSSR